MEKKFKDVVGEVDSKMIVKTEGEIDIGCGNGYFIKCRSMSC